MDSTTAGFLLLLLAGVMNASFTLPMKFTTKWNWENTWLAWTIFALLLLPPLVTLLTLPNLGAAYEQAGAGIILTVAAFGAGWGVAQVFFGLAVYSIGIALAFSIILGVSAAVGSLIPLARLHPEKVFTPGGLGIIAGVAVVILGVTVLAVAGRRREKILGTAPEPGKASFGRGLLFALLSGLGAALVNFGLAFGGALVEAARALGADPAWAPNAVWLPLMMAGAIPNLAYCFYLLGVNRSRPKFRLPGTGGYWALAAVMGIFWFASTLLYGVASVQLGELGAVIGWPVFMSLIVVTASLLGVLTGEWRDTGRGPIRILWAGVGILIVAVFVLSYASRLL